MRRAARARLIAAAFDHGQIPTIACFNKASTSLGVDLDRLIATLQTFLDDYFVPVWGTPAKLVQVTAFRKGAWAAAFLADAYAAIALGHHDLTPDCLQLPPLSVTSTRAATQKERVTA